jgi:hypothetical protein
VVQLTGISQNVPQNAGLNGQWDKKNETGAVRMRRIGCKV